jgi:hypothetical protein
VFYNTLRPHSTPGYRPPAPVTVMLGATEIDAGRAVLGCSSLRSHAGAIGMGEGCCRASRGSRSESLIALAYVGRRSRLLRTDSL